MPPVTTTSRRTTTIPPPAPTQPCPSNDKPVHSSSSNVDQTTQLPSQTSSHHSSSSTVQSMDTQFEPLDIIGTGSFGIIRKVKRTSDGLILARKELNYGRMDERDLRQLGEEVNILQNLRGNEHIVKYFERYVDKQNFMLYILMEYCSQGDLAGVISRCRRDQVHLSEDTIWSYLAQIATALADCHSSEEEAGKKKPIILHRDIKPENVFLNHFGLVKLGDFGLSKAMEMAAFTNTYVGTPYYMSPELINGQQYDVKSDIWALGCLIYELCAWHPPFHQAQTQPELAKLIREGKIPNLPRGYSSQLTALIKSMLRQDPKLRPDAKTILMVEQVKHQTRVLEVHRYARELTKKQTELEEREKALDDRETKLTARETKLQRERDYFKTQQDNHVVLQQEFQAKFRNAIEVIEQAKRIENALQDENLTEEISDVDQLILAEASDSDLTSDSTSRRIPLAENRLSLNPPMSTSGSAPSTTPTLNYVHAKRLSVPKADSTMLDPSNLTVGYGSPMKLDTPFKHLGVAFNDSGVMVSAPDSAEELAAESKPFRQVKSSKSLASLKSTYSLLTRLKSTEDINPPVKPDDGGSTARKLTKPTPSCNTPQSRRLSRRSESANGLLVCPSNSTLSSQAISNRRPTSTIGSASTPGASTNSANSAEPLIEASSKLNNSTEPIQPASSVPSAQPTILHRSPRYNYSDPDSLPSPFLKKRSSASTLVSNFLRPTVASTAPGSPRKPVGPARTCSVDTVGLGMKRIPSMLQQIRTNHAAAPPVATRPSQVMNHQKRPSTISHLTTGVTTSAAKPSLTSRLLSHKDDANAKKSGGIGVTLHNPTTQLGSKRKDSPIF